MDTQDFFSQDSTLRSSEILSWLSCEFRRIKYMTYSNVLLSNCLFYIVRIRRVKGEARILNSGFFFRRPSGHLDFIDHVVGNQPDDDMVPVVEW